MATLTVYPDAGNPAATAKDETVGINLADTEGVTWASIVGGNGDFSNNSDEYVVLNIRSDSVSARWRQIFRAIYLFDTSALTAAASISSAVFSIKGSSVTDPLNITPNLNVYSSNPASNTSVAAADYQTCGTTAFSDTSITYAGYSTTDYNDWTFNASGIAAISKTGVSKFSVRNASYDVANSSPTWSSGAQTSIRGYFADQAGTTSDPKLVITYSTTPPNTNFLLMF